MGTTVLRWPASSARAANNGLGLRGIAPEARLFGYNYLSEQCCEEDALGASSRSPNSAQIDIFNMSYGSIGTQRNADEENVLRAGTTDLREGLGAVYVKSAGNAFNNCLHFSHQIHDIVGCASAHGDDMNDLPYAIVVGALDASGGRATYSSVGSNLWIAAPAGQWGVNEPATITTDQYGLNRGYSSRNYPGIARSRDADPYGDYSSNFNGTSAAAPHVTGVVALLLDERPDLTWRDVKHVLAATARKPNPSHTALTDARVMIGNDSAVFARDWVTNAAGYDFHNHFGFGIVDVDSSLQFLRDGYRSDSLGTQTRSDWFLASTEEVPIPDHDGAGVSEQLNVDLPADANIEAVVLDIEGTHQNLGDLSIELISPAGTPSILNPVFNQILVADQSLDWHLLSNAYYGESPRGTWTLRVIDAATGDTGTISTWALRVWYGSHP